MSNTTEYKNDSYTVEVTTEPGCRVTFNIAVAPAATVQSYKKALKTINKEVSIPGFRKGKAPNDIIEQHYGSHVEREWKEALLQTSFQEAMKFSSFYPFRKDSVTKAELKKCSKEEGSEVVIAFEAMPKVPDIDVKSLSVEKIKAEPVQEKKVEQILEDIRYQFAEWDSIEGRPVEVGDFVDVDIEDLDNNGEFICQDTRVEVAPGKIGKWLIELMKGMNVGESAEATSEQEEGQESDSFRPTRCRVTIKGIFKSTLPEMDDELAKKAGAEGCEDLRNKVVKDIEAMNKRDAQEMQREILRKAVVKQYPFEVPYSLTTELAQNIINDRRLDVENSEGEGADIEEKLRSIEEEAHNEARETYAWQFIIQEVAEREKIAVGKEELTMEMMRLHMHKSPIIEGEQSEVMNRIFYLTLSKKVLDKWVSELVG